MTGFNAPPATYLYIDKKMQDHGLFQAICRVNRLDGEEAVKALCEPVEPPRDTDAYRRYFCHEGKGDTAGQLAANERKRLTLYRMLAAFLRAYVGRARCADPVWCGSEQTPTSPGTPG